MMFWLEVPCNEFISRENNFETLRICCCAQKYYAIWYNTSYELYVEGKKLTGVHKLMCPLAYGTL